MNKGLNELFNTILLEADYSNTFKSVFYAHKYPRITYINNLTADAILDGIDDPIEYLRGFWRVRVNICNWKPYKSVRVRRV